jgi:tRNA pseudouridine38-40 synthase
MPRYKAIVEYEGSGFVGWQRQENGLSVQETVERALHEFCGEWVNVTAAGRTDSGVHALAQVIHFDLSTDHPAGTVMAAINFHVKPARVSVLSVEIAAPDFNARFDAVARHYRYRIINRKAPLAVDRGSAWHVAAPLDVDLMNDGARRFVGHHDFTSFRATRCQAKSPEKTLRRLEVVRDGEVVDIAAEALSFLHNQVRIMVGALKLVGEGKWSADDITAALEARDRARGALTAPPEGLYLVRVDYPSGGLSAGDSVHE